MPSGRRGQVQTPSQRTNTQLVAANEQRAAEELQAAIDAMAAVDPIAGSIEVVPQPQVAVIGDPVAVDTIAGMTSVSSALPKTEAKKDNTKLIIGAVVVVAVLLIFKMKK